MELSQFQAENAHARALRLQKEIERMVLQTEKKTGLVRAYQTMVILAPIRTCRGMFSRKPD